MKTLNTTLNKDSLSSIRKMSFTNEVREGFISTMKAMRSRYHLTVTFTYGMSERLCNEMLNELLKYLNRSILKKRYNKSGEFIRGIAVRETTPSMENTHYHIIIEDREWKLPNRERLEELLKRKINLVNKKQSHKNKINRFLLQDYYTSNENSSLEHYVTKLFENPTTSIQIKMDSVQPLDHNGAKFEVI